MTVQVAIEYPESYQYEKNIFYAESDVKVVEQLSVAVPKYQGHDDEHTSLYLMPRNVLGKIVTNKNVKLRMGYSMQSVFINSTQQYEYKETRDDIIELMEGVGIKTLDKYGKVTVILEENQQFGDQVVMLNVLITDIASISAENFYEALNLPLASSIKIPLRFSNERAHLFARNLSGIGIGYQLSHPKVVSVALDEFNQTLTLTAG